MPEWLLTPPVTDAPLSAEQLAGRLVAALLLGCGVALIYRLSHGRSKDSSLTLTTTLVLLSVLIAMVTLTIGNSVARAFSLVGALSIVRFRTVVDDTRDTAFVIFAVIVGMSAGAGLLIVPLLGLPVVGLAAVTLSLWGSFSAASEPTPEIQLKIRLGLGRDPQQTLGPALSRSLQSIRLQEAGTARQGAALDLTYAARLIAGSSLADLVTQLNKVEGVQSAEASLSPG